MGFGDRLQNLHLLARHPPKIGVEDDDVSSLPVPSMLHDGPCSNDPLSDSVNDGIVRIGFHQKRSPVEFDSCIVVLAQGSPERWLSYADCYRKKCWRDTRTLAVKTVRESKVSMDLAFSGMTRCSRHTIDTNWPRFKESPTNSIRLPRSISSVSVALKLHITKNYLIC